MRIWDDVKKAWKEATSNLAHPDIETGAVGVASPGLMKEIENHEDYEIRHQEVYNHVTGVSAFGPVRVKKSDLGLRLIPIAMALLGALCVPMAQGQTVCPGGTSRVVAPQRNSADSLDDVMCYDPVNRRLTLPLSGTMTVTAATTFTGAVTPAAVTDGYAFLAASNCQATAVTTAFTAGPALVRTAANNIVLQATTNATGGTVTLDCDLDQLQTRLTALKGATVNSVDLYYGFQTTAISSIAPAILSTVTYPATGAAAAGTVAAAGGSLTPTPGTLQLTTTTTGQCFHENIALGTPLALNSGVQKLSLEQVFTNSAAATVIQICGVGVNFSYQY